MFKGPAGKYGKGENQISKDDLVLMKNASHFGTMDKTYSSFYHRINIPLFNYSQILNILFIVCSIVLIIFKFFIDHLFVSQHERNFEDIVTKLCFAFIGSYIFYNIVSKTTDKIKKSDSYAIICGLLDTIVYYGNEVKKLLVYKVPNGENINFDTITLVELRELCSKIDIHQIHDQYNISVAKLIVHNGVKKIKDLCDKIFTFMPFLDSDLIHVLNKTVNSKFAIYIVVIPDKEKSDLEQFTSEIYDFLKLMKELDKFNQKLKKKYLKNDYGKLS